MKPLKIVCFCVDWFSCALCSYRLYFPVTHCCSCSPLFTDLSLFKCHVFRYNIDSILSDA